MATSVRNADLRSNRPIFFLRENGSYFVYPHNGPIQFLQHLTFTSAWSEAGEHSFNGPAWSLAAEFFLYVVFALMSSVLPARAWMLIAMVVLGEVLYEKTYVAAFRGIEPFFLGGLALMLYHRIVSSRRVTYWAVLVSVVSIGTWAIGIATTLSSLSPSDLAGTPYSQLEHRAQIIFDSWARLVVFPITVLALALIETSRGSLGRRLSFIGDISFSSYLLHFPLQLTAVLIAGWLSVDRSIFYSPVTMLGFFAILIVTSFMSYRFFEMPIQKLIRSKI